MCVVVVGVYCVLLRLVKATCCGGSGVLFALCDVACCVMLALLRVWCLFLLMVLVVEVGCWLCVIIIITCFPPVVFSVVVCDVMVEVVV